MKTPINQVADGRRLSNDGDVRIEKTDGKVVVEIKCGSIKGEEPDYKIRLNENITVQTINSMLDMIDANDGYCPCQRRSESSKCHCKDFIENKKIGEPCICNIYVKQEKTPKNA